jgi:hypothetical protein
LVQGLEQNPEASGEILTGQTRSLQSKRHQTAMDWKMECSRQDLGLDRKQRRGRKKDHLKDGLELGHAKGQLVKEDRKAQKAKGRKRDSWFLPPLPKQRASQGTVL